MIDAALGFSTDLGSILVRMGACTWAEVNMAVEKQEPPESLGQILVDAGIISPGILSEALELQKTLRGPKNTPVFVTGLERLFNHAMDRYSKNNANIGVILDAVKR